MFAHLTIDDPRERAIVGVADAMLSTAGALVRPFRRLPVEAPRRILLLRLERIGDLLMTLDAVAAVRALAPAAEIDLVVGSWNRELAALMTGPDRVETLDAPWLTRGDTATTPGARPTPWTMAARAREWRRRRYDLAINFEGDIRTNLLLAAAGARQRIGFAMAGGGAALTRIAPHDPRAHTRTNTLALVGLAFGARAAAPVLDALDQVPARLQLTDALRSGAASRLDLPDAPKGRARFIGIHPSGGRAIKQWDADRFGAVARRLADEREATIVLTGASSDRELAQTVARAVEHGGSRRVIDLTGSLDLPLLAAVLERLDLLVTGDTGPMHLAASVGTPVVAIFGPSDPARYAPRVAASRVVRIDLPCSPCNRIRRPPARCVGQTPDCLAGVTDEAVHRAAADLLGALPPAHALPRSWSAFRS